MPRATSPPYPNVAATAALIGDPVRSSMLYALLGGGELCASELARRAGSSAQSASGHLAKLVAADLVSAAADGRRRLFRLRSAEVARALEALAAIAPAAPVRSLRHGEAMTRLREARSCYDHLAGRLAVVLADRLVERHYVAASGGAFDATAEGAELFASLGIDLDALRARRRTLARACVDWTERRPHLAGGLGAALLERFLSTGWFERIAGERALRVTPRGRTELARRFDVS